MINDNDLAFEWSTREEGGLRPVDCYYGNVTVRGRSNSNTLSTGRETVYEFDLCTSNAPRDVEYIFSEESVESSKEYVIVVCSRNALGINCSQPSIFSLPTVAPPPSTPPLITLDPPTAPVLGLVPGVIVGIVVGVVLALCCCLMLLLLLILFCCSWSREKRYFPQKRGEGNSLFYFIDICVYSINYYFIMVLITQLGFKLTRAIVRLLLLY